ncbi:MAG: shikimate kinase [bacterium]|nr:shikimate kinase [bacterium]
MENGQIFFIGPASVGKTTIGKMLASKINYAFVDVDAEFCKQIQLIPNYVDEFGYKKYCEENSKLVDKLISESSAETVFATPSGYLVHENSPHLIEKHLSIIKNGVSILLLPSRDPLLGVGEIVRRQLSRWSDCYAEKERKRFLERFEKYKNYGDIQIYSPEKPNVIVGEILEVQISPNLYNW